MRVHACVYVHVSVCVCPHSPSPQSLNVGLYFTGDGAYRDDDGHYQITGRLDDVIIMKGHRIGSAELESAMVKSSYL